MLFVRHKDHKMCRQPQDGTGKCWNAWSDTVEWEDLGRPPRRHTTGKFLNLAHHLGQKKNQSDDLILVLFQFWLHSEALSKARNPTEKTQESSWTFYGHQLQGRTSLSSSSTTDHPPPPDSSKRHVKEANTNQKVNLTKQKKVENFRKLLKNNYVNNLSRIFSHLSSPLEVYLPIDHPGLADWGSEFPILSMW